MNIGIYYSSRTGNTEMVARGIYDKLSKTDLAVSIENSEKTEKPAPADVYVLCFWCDKGTVDQVSKDLADKLEGEKIIVVGTMGGDPASPYGDNVKKQSTDCIATHNHVLGTFLCQGKIPEAVTERRRSLPKDHPHYLNDQRYASHLESRKHPNEEDVANATSFVEKLLEEIK